MLWKIFQIFTFFLSVSNCFLVVPNATFQHLNNAFFFLDCFKQAKHVFSLIFKIVIMQKLQTFKERNKCKSHKLVCILEELNIESFFNRLNFFMCLIKLITVKISI